MAISVDAPEASRELCNNVGYTFPFLSDPDAKVIKQFGIVHKGGGEHGQDVARPAEFLVDKSGVVRWENFTEDLRVRARAEQMLAAAQKLP